MKKIGYIILFIWFAGGVTFAQGTITSLRTKTVLNTGQWVSEHFARGKKPPFSFVYGGKNSDSFITGWKFQSQKLPAAPDKEVSLFTWTDPRSGLAVKCEVTAFKDFQAVEWVLKFVNTSGGNTPLIEKAKVIDHAFSTAAGHFILHHSKGSDTGKDDFEPFDQPVQAGEHVYMSPDRGRSSDGGAFPFFNIEAPGQTGVVVAVGWTGKWYADVSRPAEKRFTLESGMEQMLLSLYPGEEIRTPRICLLFWNSDDRMTGHNLFRRFVLKHHSRQIDGKFAEYPLCVNLGIDSSSPCELFECLTEAYATGFVDRFRFFGVSPDAFWVDAGWYEGCGWNKENGKWWENVGNWTPDKERFPDGFRPVTDAIHRAGSKFILWLEPERVRPGTQFYTEHPEWLVKIPGDDNALFDLGNPEACRWLTDYMTAFFKRDGIDYYRQDFNFDPYPYWNVKDQPGRVGMAEIRHIEGLYAYWDSLLVRFPRLLIDNCASGGRRLDLETMSRSAPVWRSDFMSIEASQCHTYGLNFYLPVHGQYLTTDDAYSFRSGMTATATCILYVSGRIPDAISHIQGTMENFKELQPYNYGDYYPLTPYSSNDDVWMAYQLNRPEQGDGIILAFRRDGNTQDSIKIKLSGIQNRETYDLHFVDAGTTVKKTGLELTSGIDVNIPHTRESLLIKYRLSKQ
jgi:alpha-galactosidase